MIAYYSDFVQNRVSREPNLSSKTFMHLRAFTLIMTLVLSTQAIAQMIPAEPSVPGVVVPLWPDKQMPGRGADKPETRNTPPAGGLIKVTEVSQPTIEIFKAPGAKGPVPAMIISPGGGYALLSYNYEGTQIANWLNSLGITGIVLKYRVPNNREGAYQDLQRAMRLTRLHAAEWGILPDKLGVIGFSAGGHLSARLSNNFDRAAYPGIDDADKLSCRPDFVILVYPAYLADSGKLASDMPLSPATPETLIIHTEDDLHHYPGSKIYDAAMTNAKIPHEFLSYPSGGHGFSLHSDKAAKVWPEDAAKWLHKIGIL